MILNKIYSQYSYRINDCSVLLNPFVTAGIVDVDNHHSPITTLTPVVSYTDRSEFTPRGLSIIVILSVTTFRYTIVWKDMTVQILILAFCILKKNIFPFLLFYGILGQFTCTCKCNGIYSQWTSLKGNYMIYRYRWGGLWRVIPLLLNHYSKIKVFAIL